MAVVSGTEWGTRYQAEYAQHSEARRTQRAQRREKERDRTKQQAPELARQTEEAKARLEAEHARLSADPGFKANLWSYISARANQGDRGAKLLYRAGCQPVWDDMRRQRAAETKQAVNARMRYGYHWKGGSVGDNAAYHRDPFTYQGLVSDDHPILKKFVEKTPKAARLKTGHTKAESYGDPSKLIALDNVYVDANSQMRGVLRVELDQVCPSFQSLKTAIMMEGVPQPNLVVGYIDRKGQLHNPHLLWIIDHSVPFVGKGRFEFMGLYIAVLRALNAALLPIGADPRGLLNANRHKNPLSPLWDRAVIAETPYTLDQLRMGLSAACPLNEAQKRLQEAEGSRSSPILTPDHPDLAVAAKSNAVFAALTVFARKHIDWHREHGSLEEFEQEVAAEALRIVPWSRAAERQAVATAKSVASWNWENWKTGAERQPKHATPAARAEARADAARQTATARTEQTVGHLAGMAQGIKDSGQKLTQASLAQASGKSVETVKRHWQAVQNAIAPTSKKGVIQSCSVKRDLPRTTFANNPSEAEASSPPLLASPSERQDVLPLASLICPAALPRLPTHHHDHPPDDGAPW